MKKKAAKKNSKQTSPKPVKKAAKKNTIKSNTSQVKKKSATVSGKTNKKKLNEPVLKGKKKSLLKNRSVNASNETGISEILLQRGEFVIERFSDTKYCCMMIRSDGRREAHFCAATLEEVQVHFELEH